MESLAVAANETSAAMAARAGLPRIEDVDCRGNAGADFGKGTWGEDRRRDYRDKLTQRGYVVNNAAQYPPPSLNKFRTAASRAPADAPPCLWYWQMTGNEWDRKSRSYQVAVSQIEPTIARSCR